MRPDPIDDEDMFDDAGRVDADGDRPVDDWRVDADDPPVDGRVDAPVDGRVDADGPPVDGRVDAPVDGLVDAEPRFPDPLP